MVGSPRRLSAPRCSGLVKAQQVKNAVIVPVGSKGGFFPEAIAARRFCGRDPGRGDRRLQESSCSGLLDLTDNLLAGWRRSRIPRGGHRHTTRSILISSWRRTREQLRFPTSPTVSLVDYGFWLDDAFASGGSAGYDHKDDGHHGAWGLGRGQAPLP